MKSFIAPFRISITLFYHNPRGLAILSTETEPDQQISVIARCFQAPKSLPEPMLAHHQCPMPCNSLAPGKFEWNFRHVIFKQILVINGWGISCEIALLWMSLVFTYDQSTLVQLMAWCRQAPSHYQSQCWPRSMSPYGVTRPQWANELYRQENVSKYHSQECVGKSHV